jgi:hypothetical protein
MAHHHNYHTVLRQQLRYQAQRNARENPNIQSNPGELFQVNEKL